MGKACSFLRRGRILFLPIIFTLFVTNAYANDEDIIDFLPAILSAAKNASEPPPPQIDYTGEWAIHEVATSIDPSCSAEVDFIATVIMQDEGVYTVDFGHKTAQGSMEGDVLVVSFTGDYPEGGGITTSDFSGTFSYDSTTEYSFTGYEGWSWTDGEYSCSGLSTFTGSKIPT